MPILILFGALMMMNRVYPIDLKAKLKILIQLFTTTKIQNIKNIARKKKVNSG